MKERTKKHKVNWYMALFVVFLFFIGLTYLKYLYVALSPRVDGIDLAKFAANRNTYSTTLYANRGTIYDKDGNTLALNVSSYTVIAYLSASRTGSSPTPLHVVDVDMTAEKLVPILNMTKEKLVSLLSKEAYQVELGPGGRGISVSTKLQIEALELPGIDFIENYKRYYPNGDFASYIIGYAKQYEEEVTKNNVTSIDYSTVGELGIELEYEDTLKGTNGYLKYEQDRFGYKIPDTHETRINATNGNNIYLTIDSNIQRFVESAVKESAGAYNPEWMTLTVMDAKTGNILGSSSAPSFNPNIRNIINYENPLVSYLYEPGSIMKIYTYMCAMESGKYNGSDTFKSGNIKIGDDTINDWNEQGWGTISYDKGFEFSSNVGVANLLQNVINKGDLRNCLEKYGFNKETNIELPRELVGQLNFNYPIEVATAGFGQGITATAIQQLQALSIIANDGVMLKPHIVNEIIDAGTGKKIYDSKIEKSKQLVSTETIDNIKQLMHNVIYGNDVGTTGGAYAIPNFNIIGKTGTSQIYDSKSGGWLTGYNDYIYSFAGMFPKDNPEIIIYVAMKQPKWGNSSGVVSATRSVIQDTAKYLNIYESQDNNTSVSKYKVESYSNKDINTVKEKLIAKGINVIVLGTGSKVTDQYPKEGTMILSNDKVFLLTNDTNIVMPNIVGWSRLDVISLCNILGLNYNFTGYGYAANQSIPVNTPLADKTVLDVIFEQKYVVEET